MNKFKIFTRTKKTYFTKGIILLTLMCSCLILYWIISSLSVESEFSLVKKLIAYCLIICFSLYSLLKLTSFWRRKPIIGEANGYLELLDDKIIANDKILVITYQFTLTSFLKSCIPCSFSF